MTSIYEPEDDKPVNQLKTMKRDALGRFTSKNLIPNIIMGVLIIFLLVLVGQSLRLYIGFQNNYTFRLQNIFLIEPRTTPVAHRAVKEAKAEVKEADPATLSTEDYICYVFGSDCAMALAVSQAENGTRQCDRFGVNTNRTIDVGVFQINTVHLKKGWTLTELTDCHKNIDYAKQLYDQQGWGIWVAYSNGNYKRFLK